MPTEALGHPKPETWRDWSRAEPAALLTRAELVDALRERHVPVTERTLVYWEGVGALPRPVRQRHRGATRAVYPDWIVPLAAQVPALKRAGVPLHEIGAHLRGAGSAAVEVGARATLTRTAPAAVAIAVEPTDADLEPILAWFARRYQEASGFAVAGVEVRITDGEGRVHAHRYPPG